MGDKSMNGHGCLPIKTAYLPKQAAGGVWSVGPWFADPCSMGVLDGTASLLPVWMIAL